MVFPENLIMREFIRSSSPGPTIGLPGTGISKTGTRKHEQHLRDCLLPAGDKYCSLVHSSASSSSYSFTCENMFNLPVLTI
jgi:hypothetical protein